MSDLFIGEWDCAGAHTADRMIREGHDVCWITRTPSRMLWSERFKGKVYQDIHSKDEFHRILHSNSVENVFFMTGDNRETALYGNANMSDSDYLSIVMEYLRDYQLNCFVLFSSIEADATSINTPSIARIRNQEQMAQAYGTTYQMPVLILRLPPVFSSRMSENDCYISWAMKQIRSQKTIQCPFPSDAYMDALEGEDIASGVYALLKNGYTGLYRMMSGHPIRMDDFYQILSQAVEKKADVIYDSYGLRISSEWYRNDRRIKDETGWMPFHLLQEESGIEILRASLLNGEKNITEKKSFLQRFRSSSGNTAVIAVVETLGLYVIMELLLKVTPSVSDLKYVDVRLMFVAICCSMHGMATGVFSIILACASYILHLYLAHVDVAYFLYQIDSWIPFACYIAMGGTIGYMSDVLRDEKHALQEKNQLLNEKYMFLKKIHQETLQIKKQLQKQITTSSNSFGHVYEVTSQLDTLNPEEILVHVIDILEDVMQCHQAAIFLLGKDYARRRACSPDLKAQLGTSLKLKEVPELMQSFQEGEVFVNTKMLVDYPDMASPIYAHGKLYGFAAVYDLLPENFTVFYQNLLRILTSLIEKNLGKALQYEEARRSEMYVEGTELLNPDAFRQQWKLLTQMDENGYVDCMKCHVKPLVPMSTEQIAEKMQSVIRNNDFMGMDDDAYAVVLMNMNPSYLDQIRERFAAKDLSIEVVK